MGGSDLAIEMSVVRIAANGNNGSNVTGTMFSTWHTKLMVGMIFISLLNLLGERGQME